MQIVLSLSLLARMMDPSLNVAQRNNACFELRGNTEAEVIATMRKALNDTAVRACAGTNLRKAGAVAELKDALTDPNFEVRALAARELGGFEKPELLPLLAAAARDPQMLVGINAIEGLADYRDPVVLPYLLHIAKDGGLVGAAALDRALAFHDPRVLETARGLLGSKDVSDQLAAMRIRPAGIGGAHRGRGTGPGQHEHVLALEEPLAAHAPGAPALGRVLVQRGGLHAAARRARQRPGAARHGHHHRGGVGPRRGSRRRGSGSRGRVHRAEPHHGRAARTSTSTRPEDSRTPCRPRPGPAAAPPTPGTAAAARRR